MYIHRYRLSLDIPWEAEIVSTFIFIFYFGGGVGRVGPEVVLYCKDNNFSLSNPQS